MSKMEHEVVVQAPADTVYQVWRNFENFPNFMSNIEQVQDMGDGRSHWKAKGPLGVNAEWDAEIVVDEPGRAIAWRSLEDGANVHTDGAVRFEAAGDATRLFVTMSYDAPAHGLGELAAKIFANPEKQVAADLRRFKEMIETEGQAGYQRSTEEVVGHGTPNTTMRVNPQSGTSQDDDNAVQGKYPTSAGTAEPPYGPGMSNDETVRGAPRPTTTGTPGGTLGAPTERDLKRDQGSISERTDTRT
ncbi:MAG: SRPBCC family protein [Dehalococcoidia bacterium]